MVQHFNVKIPALAWDIH